MAKEFVEDVVSSVRVEVYTNAQGNILQPGEEKVGTKKVTFGGFASSITADEAINTENSNALHNGVAGLMWLFSGYDEGNFNENITRTVTEEIDDV